MNQNDDNKRPKPDHANPNVAGSGLTDASNSNNSNNNNNINSNGDDDNNNHAKRMKLELETAIMTRLKKNNARRWQPPTIGHAALEDILYPDTPGLDVDRYYCHLISHNPRIGRQQWWNKQDTNIPRHEHFSHPRCMGAHSTLVVGMFDGHGTAGHDFAHYAADILPDLLQEELQLPPYDPPPGTDLFYDDDSQFEDRPDRITTTTTTTTVDDANEEDNAAAPILPSPRNALIKAFHRVYTAAVHDLNIPPSDMHDRSSISTTAMALIVEDELVHVGCVGECDARGVMVLDIVERPNSHEEIHATQSVTTATVTSIMTWPSPPEMTSTTTTTVPVMMASERKTGMSSDQGKLGSGMTRAVGDAKMLPADNIYTATYPRYLNDQEDPTSYRIVVMATDGIWNVLSQKQVVELVLNERGGSGDTSDWKAAQAVAKAAYQAYAAKTNNNNGRVERLSSDDITCVVFRL